MPPTVFPQPPYLTLVARAMRLRCPRCGQGRMFAGLFRMHAACASCGLHFEREPGYFLGSIYVNYGLTAVLTTAAYLIMRLGFDIEGRVLLPILSVFCVAFPVVFFRYARAYWLAMDCHFDRSAMVGDGLTEEGAARRAAGTRLNASVEANDERPAGNAGRTDDPSGI